MVLEFLIHILISIMVLVISLFLGITVEFKSKSKNNIAGFYGLAGMLLAGIGIYIGAGEIVHAYHYITLVSESFILGVLLLIRLLFKKRGPSKLINIGSICLVTISYVTYVYYIIASFIYY